MDLRWFRPSEVEEDYPPYALVPELPAGTFTDPDRRTTYEVRWIREDRSVREKAGDAITRSHGLVQVRGSYFGEAIQADPASLGWSR